jgi:hypothetical protein
MGRGSSEVISVPDPLYEKKALEALCLMLINRLWRSPHGGTVDVYSNQKELLGASHSNQQAVNEREQVRRVRRNLRRLEFEGFRIY